MKMVGLGTEIVEVLRIARLIERQGDVFLRHAFTAREIRFCQNRAQSTQFFAAYWAAKSAVLKAINVRMQKGLRWNDIEIRRATTNEYRVAMRGTMRELIEKNRVEEVMVSLSHCRTHANATAIALGTEK
jgi:holo-[acyl-carrier protein] synthase